MNQSLKKLLSTKSISNDLKIAIQNVIILVGCYISNSKNNKKINLKNLKSKKKFPWA